MRLRDIANRDRTLTGRVDELWRRAQEVHSEQEGRTEQGTGHCERVEENIVRLFDELGASALLTPRVAFLLSVAAAFHDVGKAPLPSAAEPDHGVRGADILEGAADLGGLFPNAEYFETVLGIIRTHAGQPFRTLQADRQIEDETVFPRRLAAVFRLADMLDLTLRRTPGEYCVLGGPKAHHGAWLGRSSITAWLLSPDHTAILLQARPRTPEHARAVQVLCSMTNRAITREHRGLLSNVLLSRRPKRHPRPIDLPQRFALRPNDKRIVWRLARTEALPYQYATTTLIIDWQADTILISDESLIAITAPCTTVTTPAVVATPPCTLLDRCIDGTAIAPTSDPQTISLGHEHTAGESFRLTSHFRIAAPASEYTIQYQFAGQAFNAIDLFVRTAGTPGQIRAFRQQERRKTPLQPIAQGPSPGFWLAQLHQPHPDSSIVIILQTKHS